MIDLPPDPAPVRRPLGVRFPLGSVIATPGALSACATAGVDPASLLMRHAACDWGGLDAHDWSANDMALVEGGRLLSLYTVGGRRCYVITEHDRSYTSLLLADEY